MTHRYTITPILFALCAFPATTFAQMDYYLASSFGSRFNDINDNGTAVSGGAYFDFATEVWTPMEPEAIEMVSINNNGDVAGSMFLDEELFILQPGYQQNSVWTPIGWFPASNPQESSFSTFSMEDHHGTHDFMLFSEDYMKYKLYMQQGALLFLKGRASARTWGRDEGQMEFKISNIDLLSDAREKYITRLNVVVDADRVTADIAHELGQLLQASPGKCKVNFVLTSPSTNTTVEAAGKAHTVALTEELVRGLDGLMGLKWTLN
jgi:hypothetical protein